MKIDQPLYLVDAIASCDAGVDLGTLDKGGENWTPLGTFSDEDLAHREAQRHRDLNLKAVVRVRRHVKLADRVPQAWGDKGNVIEYGIHEWTVTDTISIQQRTGWKESRNG